MDWDVLRSAEDRSVNFTRPAPDGGRFEARFVARSDDYAIAYLSSHSGCRLACRFCHLTQTGQTMFGPATQWDLMGQLMRVLRHMDEGRIRPPRINVNFMARGEPLANPHLTEGFGFFAEPASREAARRGMGIRFNLSTVFPADQDIDLTRAFGDFPVTPYWSLWSVDPGFRKRWLPRAEAPERSLDRLLRFQAATGREVVLHWGLIAGKNDREGDLDGLVRLLDGSGLRARLNLVRYNSFSDRTGAEAGQDRLDRFLEVLGPVLGLPGSRVVPRVGRDVFASCGMFVPA
jgi:adenine C2-methylase RlmN of 23S rRNA A2503 and tRNA A37